MWDRPRGATTEDAAKGGEQQLTSGIAAVVNLFIIPSMEAMFSPAFLRSSAASRFLAWAASSSTPRRSS